MVDEKKVELFEKLPVTKAVLSLAVPTVISSLVTVIYNLADTYFVAMLNDPVENAAVTLAYPLMLAFYAFNNLFGVGASSMMSRGLGRKDYDTVYKSSAFGFYCALICSVLYSLFYIAFQDPLLKILGADAQTVTATVEYLKWTVAFGATPAILNVVMAHLVRAEGASLHASVGTMSGCVLNIILDPIFILPGGLDMGAAGAGLATFISNCAACLYFFVLLFVKRKKTYVCIRPSMFRFEKDIVKGVCGVGIPAMIQNLLNVTGTMVLNNFAASYGADAVAAMGIVNKITSVPFHIALGLSQGVMPLVSYNFASRNIKRMKNAFFCAARIALIFLTLVMVIYYIGAKPIMNWFIETPSVIEHGAKLLKGSCLALPFLCMDFMAVGVFQACGMGSEAFVFAVMRKIVLEIPALFILNRVYPLYGLAYAQPIAEFVLAIAAVIVLAKLFKSLSERSDGVGKEERS